MNESKTPEEAHRTTPSNPRDRVGSPQQGADRAEERGRERRPIHDAEVPGPEEAWMGAGAAEPGETVVRAESGGILSAEQPRGERRESRPPRREPAPAGGREQRRGERPERDEGPSPGNRSGGERGAPWRSTGPVAEEAPPRAGRPARGGAGLPRHQPRWGRLDPRREPSERQPIPDEEIEASLPQEKDPLKRALALLGHIGMDEGEERDESEEGQESTGEAGGDGGPAPAQAAAPGPTEEPEASPARREERPERGAQGAEPRRRPRVRTLFTLQEVHERTGIPYATLALYAATMADSIPSAGERYSPAYPREGLEVFCRIHADKNPGWEPPAEALARGWDDADGLAARLEALEDGQRRLADELRDTLQQVSRAWHGEAEWV